MRAPTFPEVLDVMTKDEIKVLRYRVGQMLEQDTHSAWPTYRKGGIVAILPKGIIRRAARVKR
jgi:hypothetical protein